MVSTKKNKKAISFLLASVSIVLVLGVGIFSCGKDIPETETVNFQVDFLINKMDVPSLEEYSSDELLANDSLYSLKIQTGSLISLMDITNQPDKIKTWEWSLKPFGSDENIEGKKVLSNTKEFEYRPAEEGRFVIELWINGSVAGTGKIVDVLEELVVDYVPPFAVRGGEYVESDPIAANNIDPAEDPTDYLADDTTEPAYDDYQDNTSYPDNTDYQDNTSSNQKEESITPQPDSYNKPDAKARGPSTVITPVPVTNPARPRTTPSTPTKPYVKPAAPTKPIAKPKKLPTITRIIFKPSTTVANVGDKVNFEDKSEDRSIINTRTWDFGDGTPAVTKDKNTNRVSHVFDKEGDYKIKLCLNNSSKDCITKTVKIIKKPENKPLFSSIDFNTPKTIYEGESISLTDKSSPQKNILNRYWDFGDGSPSRTAKNAVISYKFNKTGSYTITLCLNNKGGKNCVTKKISVIKKPAPEKPKEPEVVIALSDIILNASKKKGDVGESFSFSDKTSKKVSKREWFINDQLIGSGQTLSHTFDKEGTYKVKLCLEGNKSLCKDVAITIQGKKVAPQVIDPFDADLAKKGTASYASSSKCDAASKKKDGTIRIAVTKPTLLDEMTVFTDGSGSLDITLSYKSHKGNIVKESISKSVNTGKSQVGLSDFGVVLMPGTSFDISVKPASGINLLDSSSCGGNSAKSNAFSLSGSNGLVYDLKYYY